MCERGLIVLNKWRKNLKLLLNIRSLLVIVSKNYITLSCQKYFALKSTFHCVRFSEMWPSCRPTELELWDKWLWCGGRSDLVWSHLVPRLSVLSQCHLDMEIHIHRLARPVKKIKIFRLYSEQSFDFGDVKCLHLCVRPASIICVTLCSTFFTKDLLIEISS